MIVYRIANCRYIKDLSGYGAYLEGGRWNSKGKFMLYTSQSIALSMLEVLAHLPAYLAPVGFCLLTLQIADEEIEVLDKTQLPDDWNDYPNKRDTELLGDSFLAKAKKIALKVPSCIIEQESNLLLNPKHPLFQEKVKIISSEEIAIDRRLKE